jgi:hypothetical protein
MNVPDGTTNILIPRYIKYPAPAYFTISYARADVASIIDNPKAAKVVCIILPVIIPRTDAIPALLPCAALLEMI